MNRTLMITAACATLATPVLANEYEPAMKDFLSNEVMEWSSAQVLIEAINERNAMTNAYSQAEIDALDTTWRNEVGTSDSATINAILDNDAAEFLRMQVEQSGGVITEVFIMDAQGLNVAASALTSDYWQGDEAKHQETYGVGAGAVHFGEVEFDDSSQTYQGQISMTIEDPATGAPIGALTVGVNAESLF
ncbi:MAG: hypothetical protein AAFN59_02165 [Pseudomonadota bacterium]